MTQEALRCCSFSKNICAVHQRLVHAKKVVKFFVQQWKNWSAKCYKPSNSSISWKTRKSYFLSQLIIQISSTIGYRKLGLKKKKKEKKITQAKSEDNFKIWVGSRVCGGVVGVRSTSRGSEFECTCTVKWLKLLMTTLPSNFTMTFFSLAIIYSS